MVKIDIVGLSSFTSKGGVECHVAHVVVPCNFDNFVGRQVMTAFVDRDDAATITAGGVDRSYEVYKLVYGKGGQAGNLFGVKECD